MKKKRKKRLGQILEAIFGMTIGGLFGLSISIQLAKFVDSPNFILELVMIFCALSIAAYLQIIIHEGGHLVFGLQSGYHFLSYRVGKFVWYKEGNIIKFGRFTLAGTGGQCLLSPPEVYHEKIPYLRYHMGGSIANIITAIVAIILYCFIDDTTIFATALVMFSLIGVAFAFINGIPMKLGGMPNDGMNAWNARKRESTRYHLWLQLRIVEKLSSDVRLKDMPEEWFVIPPVEELDNALSAAIGTMVVMRAMDNHQFQTVIEQANYLLNQGEGLAWVHRNMLKCELIFIELMGDCNREKIDALYSKDVKKMVKAMRTNPSIVRMEYAYALRYLKNESLAIKKLDVFEKAAKNHPYQCEILLERALLEELKKATQTTMR